MNYASVIFVGVLALALYVCLGDIYPSPIQLNRLLQNMVRF